MARPCRQFGCANYVVSQAQRGFCDAHADQRSNWNKRPQRVGSTTQRGYGHAWRKLREKVLQRDGYVCVMHSKQGAVVAATDVDHIVAKENGGTDEMDNLQSLCRACHKEKTASIDSKYKNTHK